MSLNKMSEKSKLIQMLHLVDRHYILRDKAGHLWIFNEKLHNGNYPKYTLFGRHPMGYAGYRGAKLYARFVCDCNRKDTVSVFIEDIVSTMENHHIGTWMMNQFIETLKTINNVVKIGRVYGDLAEKDDSEKGNKIRQFFRRFGFSIEEKTPGGRENISALLDELHIVRLEDVSDVDLFGFFERCIES